MTPQPTSYLPVTKVVAGALAGALSTIVVFVLDTYVLVNKPHLTGEVASAITTVFTFIVSYLIPPAGLGVPPPSGPDSGTPPWETPGQPPANPPNPMKPIGMQPPKG